jgi:putative hemolysin
MMLSLLLLPAVIIILTLVHGFFANSEMAMVSANPIKLEVMAQSGDRKSRIINSLLKRPERLFGTTLVGINLTTVVASVLAEQYLHTIMHDHFHEVKLLLSIEILTVLLMEPLILVFGELYPMSLARRFPNTTARRNAYLIRLGYLFFYPLMLFVSSVARVVNLLFKVRSSEFGSISREELELMVLGKFSGISEKTQQMLKDALDINSLVAQDVMVHLNNVSAVSQDSTVGEVKRVIKESHFSRIPVYGESIFDITATIHAVKLLGADDHESIRNYTDKLYIVPSSKPVIRILEEFRTNRKFMGIVVDEFGTCCGLVTIEDIVEELVGEIEDEYDIPAVNEIVPSSNIFDATMRLDEFFDATGIDLKTENAQTLAGIINLAAGRIARRGEKHKVSGYTFEVIDATDRAVRSVKLMELPQAGE